MEQTLKMTFYQQVQLEKRQHRISALISGYFSTLDTKLSNPTDELRLLTEIDYLESRLRETLYSHRSVIQMANPLIKELVEHLLKQGFRYWVPKNPNDRYTEYFLLFPYANPETMCEKNKKESISEYTIEQSSISISEKEEEKTTSYDVKSPSECKCHCGSDCQCITKEAGCQCVPVKDPFHVFFDNNGSVFVLEESGPNEKTLNHVLEIVKSHRNSLFEHEATTCIRGSDEEDDDNMPGLECSGCKQTQNGDKACQCDSYSGTVTQNNDNASDLVPKKHIFALITETFPHSQKTTFQVESESDTNEKAGTTGEIVLSHIMDSIGQNLEEQV